LSSALALTALALLTSLNFTDGLRMKFAACYLKDELTQLMPERALTSFTVCDAYHYFVGQASY